MLIFGESSAGAVYSWKGRQLKGYTSPPSGAEAELASYPSRRPAHHHIYQIFRDLFSGEDSSIIEEVSPEDLWYAKNEMTVWYGLEHFLIQPFPKFHHSLLVAERAEVAALAREGSRANLNFMRSS